MKIPMAVASAVLLASTLGACGGDGGGGEGSDYCKELKKAKSTYSGMSSGDASDLDETFATFHKLADDAPSEIEDDWKKLDSVVTTVEKALADAGMSPSDLGKIQKGEMPEGVDQSKLQDLAKEMAALSSSDVTGASKAIETHAKKTCKVDLNAS